MGAEVPTAAEQTAKQQQFPTVNSTRSHAHRCSRLTCHGGEQSGLVTLTFDLLTWKWCLIHNILNPHPSAYCKHHSTETALLYIHDHLKNTISSQKLSCLCLLDLYAAFDTIDHDILITRLTSWLGIHGLNWFKSYLSSRTFCVKCDNYFSSSRTSLCGVPQGSVLGPLLFIMYTSHLSTLISSLSLNHHLYADDTQLFLSFHLWLIFKMLCNTYPHGGLLIC